MTVTTTIRSLFKPGDRIINEHFPNHPSGIILAISIDVRGTVGYQVSFPEVNGGFTRHSIMEMELVENYIKAN